MQFPNLLKTEPLAIFKGLAIIAAITLAIAAILTGWFAFVYIGVHFPKSLGTGCVLLLAWACGTDRL